MPAGKGLVSEFFKNGKQSQKTYALLYSQILHVTTKSENDPSRRQHS